MKDKLSIVDPSHPIDYSNQETPPNYKCGKCGASGCKLWRLYNTFLDYQRLLCAECAAEDQKKDISDIDELGMFAGDLSGMRIDQIGYYIPAIPTKENNNYWGYTSVPEAGCRWWHNLPTLPVF